MVRPVRSTSEKAELSQGSLPRFANPSSAPGRLAQSSNTSNSAPAVQTAQSDRQRPQQQQQQQQQRKPPCRPNERESDGAVAEEDDAEAFASPMSSESDSGEPGEDSDCERPCHEAEEHEGSQKKQDEANQAPPTKRARQTVGETATLATAAVELLATLKEHESALEEPSDEARRSEEAHLKVLEDNISKVKAGLQALHAAKSQASREAKKCLPHLEALAHAAARGAENAESAEQLCVTLNAKLAELEKDVGRAQQEAREASEKAEAERAALQKVVTERSDLEARLKTARQELEEAQAATDASKTARKVHEDRAEVARAKVAELEGQLAGAKKRLHEEEQRAKDLASSLEAPRHELASLTQQLQELRSERERQSAALEEGRLQLEQKEHKEQEQREKQKEQLHEQQSRLQEEWKKVKQLREELEKEKRAQLQQQQALQLQQQQFEDQRKLQQDQQPAAGEQVSGEQLQQLQQQQQQEQEQLRLQLQHAKENESSLRKSLTESEAEAAAAKAEIDRLTERLKEASATSGSPVKLAKPTQQPPSDLVSTPTKMTNSGELEQPPQKKKRPFALLASLGPFDLSKLREMLVMRAAKRLHVSANGAPGIVGEYKLLEGAIVNGRPAWRLSGNTRNAPPFLLWLPRDGGCWVFTTELPTRATTTAATTTGSEEGAGATAEKKGTLTELVAHGKKDPLARSTQLAWTALPDDLMCTSWTKASWSEARVQAKVMVVRG